MRAGPGDATVACLPWGTGASGADAAVACLPWGTGTILSVADAAVACLSWGTGAIVTHATAACLSWGTGASGADATAACLPEEPVLAAAGTMRPLPASPGGTGRCCRCQPVLRDLCERDRCDRCLPAWGTGAALWAVAMESPPLVSSGTRGLQEACCRPRRRRIGPQPGGSGWIAPLAP